MTHKEFREEREHTIVLHNQIIKFIKISDVSAIVIVSIVGREIEKKGLSYHVWNDATMTCTLSDAYAMYKNLIKEEEA